MTERRDLLRAHDENREPVTAFELFFDLVFVLAVTQLSHRMLTQLSVRGAAETLLLLAVVWSAWVTTTWVTNWFDPNRIHVRLMLAAVMFASLFMSVAIPEAFGDDALMFAAAYVTIQVGRAAFGAVTLGTSHGWADPLSRTFQRTLFWHGTMGILWILGGSLGGSAQYVIWGLAAVGAYGAPLTGYPVPGLGRSRTEEWAVHGSHFAERCRLFIIVTLGESLLVTGLTFAEVGASSATVMALAVAFLGSIALRWIYFHRTEEAARKVISASSDPGRLARSAYTYFHVPMIAGIIAIAASDDLVVGHPSMNGTSGFVALSLGGSALFLAGHALFELTMFRKPPWFHVGAITILAILAEGCGKHGRGTLTWMFPSRRSNCSVP